MQEPQPEQSPGKKEGRLISGPNVRRAVADHVATDLNDASKDVSDKAHAFAEAALDYGELLALDNLHRALAAARAERQASTKIEPKGTA